MTDWLRPLAEYFFLTSRWLMLVALLAIGGFMMLAGKAQAEPALRSNYLLTGPPKAQTMSHCGLLQTRNKIYTHMSRRPTPARNTRIVQRQLETLGYSVGHPGIDGRYGRYTRAAVRRFQRDYALRVDGVVGVETSQALAYMAHPIDNVRKCRHKAHFALR